MDTKFKGLLIGSSTAWHSVLSSRCAAGQVLCKARILAEGTLSWELTICSACLNSFIWLVVSVLCNQRHPRQCGSISPAWGRGAALLCVLQPPTASWHKKKSAVLQIDTFQPKLTQKIMCSYEVCTHLPQGAMSLLVCWEICVKIHARKTEQAVFFLCSKNPCWKT